MSDLNFTKKALESLDQPPPGNRSDYQDTKCPGLGLRVTHAGTKTFVVRRRIDGKPERVTLGKFPAVTVDQARRQAAEINAVMAQGRNPNVEKRALRAEITLEELFDQYLELHAKPHKKSWKQDEAQFNRHLKSWRKRRLSGISPKDVGTLHTRIGRQNGIYTANRLLALLSSLFNRAREWGWQGDNPTQSTKKFKEQSRERYLQADELPRFFEALAVEPNETLRDFFLVALLTGARRTNVLEMRWDQINLERNLWTIPRTKTGDSHTVPLVEEMVSVLSRRQKCALGEWVFPSRRRKGHLVEPAKAWTRILERAGIENLRIHDLRRTLGSWQAAMGASLPVIGKTLAHKSTNTTAIYARLNLDPVRESMKAATNAMLEAGNLSQDDQASDKPEGQR